LSDEVAEGFVLLFAWLGSDVGVIEQARDEAVEEDGEDIMVDV
jgi:hypothetical protein